VNVLLIAAGTAAARPVVDALRAVAGAGDVAWVTVPDPAGRADLDPVLDGLRGRRLVVAGSAVAVGDVLVRLLRRDELGSTPLGVILDPAAPRGDLGQLPRTGDGNPRSSTAALDLAAAAEIAVTGVPRPADLVRDDHGGVLVDRAELAPWTGRRLGMRAYVDATRLVNGQIAGLTVLRTAGGALRAQVWPGRRWPWAARGAAASRTAAEQAAERTAAGQPAAGQPAASGAVSGRAVQVSCDEARLTVDGREHPRPATRRNWWVEPGGWLLVSAR
jgi:hypothetical protein